MSMTQRCMARRRATATMAFLPLAVLWTRRPSEGARVMVFGDPGPGGLYQQ